ncbi:MAG: hypothetical protein ACOX64_11325 [Candidatus Merdivicinus sp.]|jgi:hypothetical protein
MKEDLLEQLAVQQDCFISNLRTPEYLTSVIHELKRIPPEKCSCEEWSSCLSYLFERELSFSSYAEVQAFIDHLPSH